MAASVSPSSRGLATVRTSKGLFLIFSLLSLVYVTTSQTSNMDKLNAAHVKHSKVCSWKFLDLMKKHSQGAVEELVRNKAAHERRVETVSDVLDDVKDQLDFVLLLVRKVSDESKLKERIKHFLRKTMTYTNQKMETYTLRLHDTEKRLQESHKICLEKSRDEEL